MNEQEREIKSRLGVSSYYIEAWIMRLGSMPVERICHEDLSESYTKEEAHLFKLENSKYALVTESGYFCYEAREAEIDLFPTKKAGQEAFDKWVKEHRRWRATEE